MRRVLNARLTPFGTITQLSLDSTERRAQLRMQLHGVSTPIDLHVRRYDLAHAATGSWLTLVDATASRQWMTEVLHHFVVGHRFHIPRQASIVLRLMT